MPIEIREMHIKINVDDKGKAPPAAIPDEPSKIIEACLEEVARMLKSKDER